MYFLNYSSQIWAYRHVIQSNCKVFDYQVSNWNLIPKEKWMDCCITHIQRNFMTRISKLVFLYLILIKFMELSIFNIWQTFLTAGQYSIFRTKGGLDYKTMRPLPQYGQYWFVKYWLDFMKNFLGWSDLLMEIGFQIHGRCVPACETSQLAWSKPQHSITGLRNELVWCLHHTSHAAHCASSSVLIRIRTGNLGSWIYTLICMVQKYLWG